MGLGISQNEIRKSESPGIYGEIPVGLPRTFGLSLPIANFSLIAGGQRIKDDLRGEKQGKNLSQRNIFLTELRNEEEIMMPTGKGAAEKKKRIAHPKFIAGREPALIDSELVFNQAFPDYVMAGIKGLECTKKTESHILL